MHIHDNFIALSRPGIRPPEEKFLRTGNIQQRQVLERGANKNQIVVFGVIERKQTAAFYANLTVQ